MARAGETPSAAFERGQNNLPYGAAQQANDLMGLVGPDPSTQPDYQPTTPEEQFLFAQTHRPNEPVTHGAPVGPGALATPRTVVNDGDVVHNVATQALADPAAPKELRTFARRVLEGM